MFRQIIPILIVFSLTLCWGQKISKDYKKELKAQNSAIQSLRNEIEATKNRIQSEGRKEKTSARRVNNLSEEISLLQRLVREIKKEEELLVADISRTEKHIKKSEIELDTLRVRYARRLGKIYKKGQLSNLEKIFSSTSWRQAIYRTKYLKIISDLDQKTHATIRSLLVEIGQQKLGLEAALRKKRRLKRDREKTLSEVRNKKRKEQRELTKIRKSQKELKTYLTEKQAGVKQLESILKKIREDIARTDREDRIRKQQMALKAKEFPKLKGQLAWPAEGRVITKFGRQWNAKLKTTTENPGVDIKGKPGSEIRTVLGGIVTTITFLRGFGTTIIIDHGNGFYTVYSHVTNVEVNEDSEVRGGDVIAYMGDSGSINGSQLHFEIWGQGQKQNPEKWLRKK
ncbi:MAG: peptidoglycan DD-metalloendopeptidase family protein [Candidatus Marinimicrobia bacterium]|jgi:septal ring factor EnvC (AmiA/AmiB activator)|nr:peptidoglycan DD-metalloendopeptidase family protein [Candidatus Neomarinimicrobiota bacterium]MBT3676771.1 peptidoglycan DD-metalloendopeptidase family protein [Candidatus Neomarinimicrobiota bacterium]MBT3763922.1 peptidoglycan DD-metalloendopeptidase family protein [Candidatus Neomarinimicrobiota bacterium]MBT4069423.1 peptidoglycan DD-metalloendopeptidase family protein [Candidatus Neomarinimicrobiota bacterium]MBT4271126.1 peptidoglycan DD-metalloendopeptidase family protein [Candidatus